MSLQVRPGYVNPLTMLKQNQNNPVKRQAGTVQDDKTGKMRELRTKQQTLQNEMLLMQSTGSDSSGDTSEKLEALQKKLEEVSSDLRAAGNHSGGSGKQAVDTYEETEKEPEGTGIYRPGAGRGIKADILGEKPHEILVDGYYFGSKAGNKLTIEEKASSLLKDYADIYDEIVQGYKSGRRERYVQDSASETGYRKVTMSEELDLLDKGYKAAADLIERLAQLEPEDVKGCEIIANAKAKIFGEQSEEALKARDAVLRLKNTVIPENISEKMVAATKVFARQYAEQENSSLERILGSIIVFKPDSSSNDTPFSA